MPVMCKLLKGTWRLVEPDGKLVKGHKPFDTQGACRIVARELNEPVLFGRVIYNPQKTPPWACSTDSGDTLIYEKELIYVGQFQQGVDGPTFLVDEAVLMHWALTFEAFQKAGIKVPLPVTHTDNPEANRGEVIGMSVRVNTLGLPALFIRAKFRDAKAAKLALTSDVSLFSPAEFVDGKNNRYVRPIRHVALTDYPVVPKLQSFEAIAASFIVPSKEEETIMPLKKLATTLGLAFDAESTDEVIEAAIVTSFKSLANTNNEVAKVEKEYTAIVLSKDTEIAALQKLVPAKPIVVLAAHRTMLRDNRNMKLDRLVGERISPAVRDALAELYCSDASLNFELGFEQSADNFDQVIEILSKNETVQLGGSSSAQSATKLLKGDITNPKKNPLLADAERRAKLS